MSDTVWTAKKKGNLWYDEDDKEQDKIGCNIDMGAIALLAIYVEVISENMMMIVVVIHWSIMVAISRTFGVIFAKKTF